MQLNSEGESSNFFAHTNVYDRLSLQDMYNINVSGKHDYTKYRFLRLIGIFIFL